MRLIKGVQNYSPSKPVVLSIGNFDGLHLGHQYLIRKNMELAVKLDANSCLLTFFPHPRQLLKPELRQFSLILQKDQELELENIGLDEWIQEPFTQKVKVESPNSFIERLVQSMSLKAIVVGPDFRFGKNREGDVNLLQTLSRKFGFQLLIPEPFLYQGQRVSSSLIREFLLTGEVEKAKIYLGRSFTLNGQVFSGQKRGRTLGFPTANIENQCANNLRKGVYITYVYLNGKKWKAATNIGLHPTFDKSKELVIESHLLNFSENIYGEEIKLEFIKFLRPEFKFNSISDLKNQIEKDIQVVRENKF